MIKRRYWEIFYKAVLLVMVFLLGSEPLLVAAQPKQVDARQEAIDSLTASGDAYLTNAVDALSLSAGLVNSVSAIQSTSLTQISENAIIQTRADALQAAEASAIALGSIDDLANSIESVSDNLPVAFDPFQRASEGLPQQLRDDLVQEAGLSSADVDAISSGMDDILVARQDMAANGMPAAIAAQLSQAGFSQTEIDQIALVTGNRGLANTGLTTSLAQFRASQDEWADVRTQMLILNVQLMGYQIGVRQANGIEPRAVTDAELQEIAQDELRLLVHVAHLQELWGTDPNLNVGEGDWWFIEHYAGRAAERLDALVIETQNRALVQDLFVLQEIRLLALSAKNGDANYVKAELDGLGEALSFLVGDQTFISRQRDDLRGLTYVAARLASNPNVRETVQWNVSESDRAHAAKNARLRMDTLGVQELTPLFGVVAEQNEDNNIKTLVFMAGLPYSSQLSADIVAATTAIMSQVTPENYVTWVRAILTGDTDNPVLIAANIVFSLIPVLGVIPDIYSLIADPSIFIKALSVFGIIGSLGDLIGLLPFMQGVAGASFLADASVAVIKALFKNAEPVFKAVLNGFKLTEAFDVIIDFLKVTGNYIGSSIGTSLGEAIQFLQSLFTSGFKLWDNFVEFIKRVGADTLLNMGFDEGSLLVGGIIRRGGTLTDAGLRAVDNIGDELFAAGIRLSDEAKDGLGHATKILNETELRSLMQKLGNGDENLINTYLTSLQRISLDSDVFLKTGSLKNKIGVDNLAKLMTKYASNPDDLDLAKYIFGVLGDPAVSTDAVRTAMSQGPEAAKALSFWNMSMLSNSYIAKELAQRAGKDAIALGKLDELLSLGPLDLDNLANDPAAKRLIEEIAANSTHGSGNIFVLGRFQEYDGGYVLYGRYLESVGTGSHYYHSHPEIYNNIVNRFPNAADRNKLLWAINEQALNVPTANRVPFEYSLFDADAPDETVINDLWKKGEELRANGASDVAIEAEFDIIIKSAYDQTIPGRMKELKLLFFKGYENITLDADSNLFRIIP